MVGIPFPLSSSPGRSPHESAGRLINAYAEPLGKDIGAGKGVAVPSVVWRRSPGLSLFKVSSGSTYRGGIQVASTFYTAWDGLVYSYTSAGVETHVGTLTGTDKCFWARNNAANPDIIVVSPGNGAFSITASAVSSFADADLPAPNDVFFQDGYFFFTIGDGRIFATGINAVTVSALDFATAEAKADSLLRGVPYNGQAYFFGPETVEVWSDTANASGFPYSRSAVINRGLAGRYALAGYEDGFGGSLIWVAENNTVVRLNGYQAEKISPPDLDRLIEAVEDKETLEASVYVAGGAPRWVLSCETFTWEFNLHTEKWSERKSYGLERWKGTQFKYIFGKWIGGCSDSSNLVYVDDLAYDEVGDPLTFIVESGPVSNFPVRTQVARADFAFSPGTGIATGAEPYQTEPVCYIAWSRDGGGNWSNPLERELGPQSVYSRRQYVTRCGLSGPFGHRWRLTVYDPVYVAFTGGDQSQQIRRK